MSKDIVGFGLDVATQIQQALFRSDPGPIIQGNFFREARRLQDEFGRINNGTITDSIQIAQTRSEFKDWFQTLQELNQ